MLNLTEVAQRYHVPPATVRSWIEEGLLGAVNVAPAKSKRRFYRVSEESLALFERQRAVGAHKPAAKLEKIPRYFD